MHPYSLHEADSPLLISMPHVGTYIPESLHDRLVPRALEVEDTDWFMDRLYDFAAGLGASLLIPTHSRYYVDLNRPPDNQPMYPGQNNTGLCPTRFFTGDTLYRDGMEPDEEEIAQRVSTVWNPYHEALSAQLERLRVRHGHVVLFDAHSIKGELPWLFEGRLPDMNLGTADGNSCADSLRNRVTEVFAGQRDYSWVMDGRFKGGYITRTYGRPTQNVHAVQLEMSWRAYLDETPPYRWHADKAAALRPLLEQLMHAFLSWTPV